MTREEAIEALQASSIKQMSLTKIIVDGKYLSVKEALEMAIKALEQEPKMGQFAKWVATEIFDDMWEYNYEAFAEIACRKLSKLGIVREKGNEWELVELQESEVYSLCDDCEHEGSFGKEFDDTCMKCKSGSNRTESR